MVTWRLAAAETLIVGDALEPLVQRTAVGEPEEDVAVAALRGVGIVHVVAADLVPPWLAVRCALAGCRAPYVEVELALLGQGDTRDVVWLVEGVGPHGLERRVVDARTGVVVPACAYDAPDRPSGIVLTRRRGPWRADLAVWARCIVGLPLSAELGAPEPGMPCSRTWSDVRSGRAPALAR